VSGVVQRVLVVHNHYRAASPSGENTVVRNQVALLRRAGLDVETYFRSSDEIDDFDTRARCGLPLRPIYSPEDVAAFRRMLDAFRPDVVHLHNLYPLISPSIIRIAHAADIPMVQTVHNFRHVCASGIFFRDGRVCEDCHGRAMPWPAITHACYRGSRAQTAIVATSLVAHRSTFRLVDQFLPVSTAVADFLRETGVPAERIRIVPNPIPDPGAPSPPGIGFLFAGRLSREKGVELLLDAWERSELGSTTTLRIAGDGVERSSLEASAQELRGVVFEGQVTGTRIRELLEACRVVVLPSLCYEALPTIVLEALAAGRPVVTTRTRKSSDLVDETVGWHCAVDAGALARTMITANAAPDLDELGRAARHRYETTFAPEPVLSALIDAYDEACSTHHDRVRGS
jgi:glycosyltransferase involved in cell wall biosynthesis